MFMCVLYISIRSKQCYLLLSYIPICIYSILFRVFPFMAMNHSDEQWWVDHTNHAPTSCYVNPPPTPLLLVGVGAEDEEMTTSELYISWPGHLDNHSTSNIHRGWVDRLWGGGPRAPDMRGRRLPTVHWVKIIACRTGATYGYSSCAVSPEGLAITGMSWAATMEGWTGAARPPTLRTPGLGRWWNPSTAGAQRLNCWAKLFKELMVARYPEYYLCPV